MNTSRSDETSVHRTLGERMVMVARMMSVEHVRQTADEAGVDLAEFQRSLREQNVRQDLYEPPATPLAALPPITGSQPIAGSQPTTGSAQLTTPPRPILPRRERATRRPPMGAIRTATSPPRREAA